MEWKRGTIVRLRDDYSKHEMENWVNPPPHFPKLGDLYTVGKHPNARYGRIFLEEFSFPYPPCAGYDRKVYDWYSGAFEVVWEPNEADTESLLEHEDY